MIIPSSSGSMDNTSRGRHEQGFIGSFLLAWIIPPLGGGNDGKFRDGNDNTFVKRRGGLAVALSVHEFDYGMGVCLGFDYGISVAFLYGPEG